MALDPKNDDAARIWLAAIPAMSPVPGLTTLIPLQIIITGSETYESAGDKKVKVSGKVFDQGRPVPGAAVEGLTTDENGTFAGTFTGWERRELSAYKAVGDRGYFGVITFEPSVPRSGK